MKIKYLSILVLASIICSCEVKGNLSTSPVSSPSLSPSATNNLSVGSLSGSIKTTDGNINSQKTYKLDLYKGDLFISTISTDADGSYKFNDIAVGSGYSIKVSSNNYNDFWYYDLNVVNETNTVDQIYLSPNSIIKNTVKGTIRDYSNLSNLQGALIKAFSSTGLLVATSLVDASGNYNINMPLGLGYYFEISKENFQKLVYKNINVNSGLSTSLQNLVLTGNDVKYAKLQGNLNIPNVSTLSDKLNINVYKNIDGIKYFVQSFLSGLNGYYDLSLPIGTDYFFDFNYNNKLYSSSRFTTNLGNNSLNNLSFNLGDTTTVSPTPYPSNVLVSPTPIPYIIPSVIPSNPISYSGGKILFNRSDPSSFGQIYVTPVDSFKPSALSFGSSYNLYPQMSPDGTKILCINDVLGLSTSSIDGKNIISLNKDLIVNINSQPTWSNDGKKIALSVIVKDKTRFGDTYRGNTYEIITINADGTNKIQLTTGVAHNYVSSDSTDPTWSPDSTKIVYISNPIKNPSLYIMNSDGSNQNKISKDDAGSYYSPSISPDGKKLVFVKDLIESEAKKTQQIYISNIDGSNELLLTKNAIGNNFSPSWSPDSSKIIFVSSRDTDKNLITSITSQIYTMNIDGSNQVRVSDNKSNEKNPNWSK